MTSPCHLRCTYRLQLRAGFGFAEAAAVADYLAALGISHVYCSPYLQAAPGSAHGYDVLDHHNVNPELGGTLGHETFCNTLGQHGLGQVLDTVPNHMSIAHAANRWWWDVLENGPSSRYAGYFDVDWEPVEKKLHNLVSVPILGDHYGRILEAGEVQIEREDGSFRVRYHEAVLPLAPRSLEGILSAASERAESDLLAFAADMAYGLPLAALTDRASVNRRHRDKEVLRKLLDRELREQPALAAAVDEVLADINASPDELDVLLERQNYRLAFWRTAKHDLGYRRFFDINTLVGLRAEDERVFADTHALVLHWLAQGVIDGLRIDHPDGLRDPEQYFQRMASAAPQAWIVAEKIVLPGEELPASWPVAGSTGYEFVNRVLGVLIDPRGEAPLTELYGEFTGETTDYAALAHDLKHLVMRELFASDMNRLTAQLADICEQHRRYRDYTRRELNSMLREVIACLGVYRTYVRAAENAITEVDRAVIDRTIDAAKAQRPDLDGELFDFFRRLWTLEIGGPQEYELVMRFQQCTGPVMAKGIEDTLFYCYNRFVALNEVGGEPSHFGLAVEEFHRLNQLAQEQHPRGMLATATHDTKRGEDVRARLALLAEIPQRWAETVRAWSAMTARYRTKFGDEESQPSRNAEYFFYQTLVGAWPLEADRAWPYLLKAARESKQHTSWMTPDEQYEQALQAFVERSLADAEFRRAVEKFVAPLIAPGRVNSLAQTLLKLTSPGVPDIYQGCELWDLSLVDPDNRRPVDYDRRRALLAELDSLSVPQILARADEGLPKLWLVRQTLRLHKEQPELFDGGSYEPLHATGEKAAHVIAFIRGGAAITIVPRWPLALAGNWGETKLELPEGSWRNVLSSESFSGGSVKLTDLTRQFPAALLLRQ